MNLILLLLACGSGDGDSDDVGTTEACGDVDGPGTDTGNIPNILGNWTSSFATAFYDDGTCAVEGLNQSSESWIGAFELVGSPTSSFYVTFADRPDERFWGSLDPMGGISLTGEHDHPGGRMIGHFGGIVLHDQYLDTDVIEGAAVLAMDVDGDLLVDCSVRGSWKAYKSGV